MPDLSAVLSTQHAAALRERDRFLDEHPELKALQQEIDRRLQHALTPHNRMVLINQLMMDSFLELHRKLQAVAKARTQRRAG